MRRAKGWLWFVRRFGARRAFWYWREGGWRGWMTDDESEEFLGDLIRSRR